MRAMHTSRPRPRAALLLVGLLPLGGCSEYEVIGQKDELGGGADSGPAGGGDSADPDTDTDTAVDTAEEPEPDIEVSPDDHDAGTVEEGSLVEVDILVRNVGEADLHLFSGSSGWSLSPDPADVILAPDETLVLHLETTAEVGDWTDALLLQSNDPDEAELTVPLAYRVPDPCSWESWLADDTCEGGWPGTGVDGDVTLSGDFAPLSTTLSTAVTAGTALQVADATGFAVDDEVVLQAADGTFLLGRVSLVGTGTIELSEAVSAPEGATVQRVPHYRRVTVDEELTGSLVVFRACGDLRLDADLSADGGGHAGGQRATAIPEEGWQGSSELGAGTQSASANGTGGGGGSWSCNVHADGGGGGHATAGTEGGDWDSYYCGGPGGSGGGTVGDELLSTGLFFGGGGGSGYYDNDAGAGGWGGAGGDGGGIVYIVVRDGIGGQGRVLARGDHGEDGYWPTGGTSPGGGGGGAGGTIFIVGDGKVDLDASGGEGGEGSEAGMNPTSGGTGGVGRIRVDGSWSGDASPELVSGCD